LGVLDFFRRKKRNNNRSEMYKRIEKEHYKRVHERSNRQRDSLIPLLKSPNVVTRRKAAEGLKYFSGTPQISRALREALRDSDVNVRANAAISLWEIEAHGQDARRTLEQMLRDEENIPGRQNEYVRQVLCNLLGKIYFSRDFGNRR